MRALPDSPVPYKRSPEPHGRAVELFDYFEIVRETPATYAVKTFVGLHIRLSETYTRNAMPTARAPLAAAFVRTGQCTVIHYI